MDSDFRKIMKIKSEKTMAFFHEQFLNSQALLGTHNNKKLRRALGNISGLNSSEKKLLLNSTLLDENTHKTHASNIEKKYLEKWKRAKKTGCDETNFKFFTLIDSVTSIHHEEALKAASAMKQEILKVLNDTKNIWLIGAIEAEVISIKIMRELKAKQRTDAETRKLDVCEDLLRGTPYHADDSLFLIHFHGLLFTKNDAVRAFNFFNEKLLKVKQWAKAPRQIEIKNLSTHWGGKEKKIENSLSHIAAYITKGGNDFINGKSYLRYKVSFEKNSNSEEAWVTQNWKKNRILKIEHIEEGITDPFSMTNKEIIELALFIDNLMNLDNTRTGYLISSYSIT